MWRILQNKAGNIVLTWSFIHNTSLSPLGSLKSKVGCFWFIGYWTSKICDCLMLIIICWWCVFLAYCEIRSKGLFHHWKWFEPSRYKLGWNLITQVKWVQRRTVGYDWHFNILGRSHLWREWRSNPIQLFHYCSDLHIVNFPLLRKVFKTWYIISSKD